MLVARATDLQWAKERSLCNHLREKSISAHSLRTYMPSVAPVAQAQLCQVRHQWLQLPPPAPHHLLVHPSTAPWLDQSPVTEPSNAQTSPSPTPEHRY